jgi:hypothetical protein
LATPEDAGLYEVKAGTKNSSAKLVVKGEVEGKTTTGLEEKNKTLKFAIKVCLKMIRLWFSGVGVIKSYRSRMMIILR